MNRRGSIVIALLFMLLLAASGLALLTHTGIHLKIVAARKDRRLEAAALGQALLLGLHRYREKLAAADMNAYSAPLDDFFDWAHFSEETEDGFLRRHQFNRFLLRDDGALRVTRVHDLIRVSGSGRQTAAARAGVDLVSGDIPVGECGLLIAQETAMTPDAFLAAHGVEYAGSQLPQVGGHAVEIDARGMLAEVLGLPVEIPDWRRIRERFGLAPSAAPIPPGIYLAYGDGEVEAVFVEGDLERLVFAAADGWQSIAFRCGGRYEELRYRPGENSLAWSGDDGQEVASFSFTEKIVVHGSVWSVEQAGAAAFLGETRIELLACGRLVVRTGLECESLNLGQERLPGLLLMTSGRDFLSNEEVAADVVIDMAGPATIQAQVVSAGDLVNGAADVKIGGSLFARNIENEGKLQIDAAAGDFALAGRVLLREFKFLKNFRVHFVEEGGHEE